jgi:hypothetical protein
MYGLCSGRSGMDLAAASGSSGINPVIAVTQVRRCDAEEVRSGGSDLDHGSATALQLGLDE